MVHITEEKQSHFVNFSPIPHNRPTLGNEEIQKSIEVIQSGWVAQGKFVKAFEDQMCEFLGLPPGCAVAVSSGTAALYLALLTLNIKNKTVAYPAHTCSALRNAVVMANGKHQLIDSQLHSPNIDLNQIKENVDIAIIPHMYGFPVHLKQNTKYKTIEDCAQSIGATVDGISVGLQGDIGVYSFYATKLITSGGQGGMVVSKDLSIIKFIKDYLQFDQRCDSVHRFNFQMTDLQAAIGIEQLKKLPRFIEQRRELFQLYKDANLPLLDIDENSDPVRFRALLKTSKQNIVISALKKHAISAVVPLKAEHLLGAKEHYPHAFQWTKSMVSLPLYPSLSTSVIQRIIQIVSDVL